MALKITQYRWLCTSCNIVRPKSQFRSKKIHQRSKCLYCLERSAEARDKRAEWAWYEDESKRELRKVMRPITRIAITNHIKRATPAWADHRYIRLFYVLAKTEAIRIGERVEVDHIVPLRGRLVCGLHCEHNLQLLTRRANQFKGNLL